MGMTTLDVLAVGLLAVSVFEIVLGGLRTYCFLPPPNGSTVWAARCSVIRLIAIVLFSRRGSCDLVGGLRELENIRASGLDR